MLNDYSNSNNWEYTNTIVKCSIIISKQPTYILYTSCKTISQHKKQFLCILKAKLFDLYIPKYPFLPNICHGENPVGWPSDDNKHI